MIIRNCYLVSATKNMPNSELKLRNKMSLVLSNMEIDYDYFSKKLKSTAEEKKALWEDLKNGYGRRDVIKGGDFNISQENKQKDYVLEGDKTLNDYITKKVTFIHNYFNVCIH